MKQYFLPLSFAAFIFAGSPGHAFDTVSPNFSGDQAEFGFLRTRITDAMLDGPNFADHYTIVTVGCGTGCSIGIVGDNETGKLYHFPFGGEEHSQMQLEFNLDENRILVSFLYNPYYSTQEAEGGSASVDEDFCVAKQLRFLDGDFVEERSHQISGETFTCPTASELFEIQ